MVVVGVWLIICTPLFSVTPELASVEWANLIVVRSTVLGPELNSSNHSSEGVVLFAPEGLYMISEIISPPEAGRVQARVTTAKVRSEKRRMMDQGGNDSQT